MSYHHTPQDILIGFGNTFYVSPSSGCLYGEGGRYQVAEAGITQRSIQSMPFWVLGAHRYDLAAFATSINVNDGIAEHDLLVLNTIGYVGRLATTEALENNPSLITRELARKFATLQPNELDQLNISTIVEHASRLYPDARPL